MRSLHLSPLDRLMCSNETSGLPLTVGREAMARCSSRVVFLASAVGASSRNRIGIAGSAVLLESAEAGRATPMEFAATFESLQCEEILPSLECRMASVTARKGCESSVVRGQNPCAAPARADLVRTAPIQTHAVPT